MMASMTGLTLTKCGLAVLAVAVAAAGCGGTDGQGAAKDLRMAAKPDMTMVQPEEDLTMLPDLTLPEDLTMEEPEDLAKKPPDMASVPMRVMVGPNFSSTFAPAQVTIKVGGTVIWQWASANHNVVSGANGAPDNRFCNDNDMNCAQAPLKNAGDTYSHKFNQAGRFEYFCAPHFGAGMVGTVIVQ